MTQKPTIKGPVLPGSVLLAVSPADLSDDGATLDAVLRRRAINLLHARTERDAIDRVERGGLCGALVWEDEARLGALSLLQIIRSIDVALPCWLITRRPTRHVLEAALSLRVESVITHPLRAEALAAALRRVLSEPTNTN